MHFLTDGQGIPISVVATPGQKNEGPAFEDVMHASLIKTFHNKRRPKALAGDKAYRYRSIRHFIAKRNIEDVIPTQSNEIPNPNFDKEKYRRRNVVERFIGWLKEYRRIATRYEKLAENYLAMVKIAIIRMLINWD